MRLLCIFTLVLLLGMVSAFRMDPKRRIQSIYRIDPLSRVEGIKGGATTQRNLRKGEYVCGNQICRLRPDEVPKGCEGGECQYNIGYHPRN